MLATKMEEVNLAEVEEAPLPEAIVFGPVEQSATQLVLKLHDLLRERMGSGTDTYFWPAQDRGYYVLTLDVDDKVGRVDERIPRAMVQEDYSLNFWVRRYARKEDYRTLRQRERRACVSGRVWSTPKEGVYIAVGRDHYGRATLDRDLERFFASLAGRIGEITGKEYSETGFPTLYGYGMASYFYTPNREQPDEGLLGPLDVPYLDLRRLLCIRMRERLREDGSIFRWPAEGGVTGVRLVLLRDISEGCLEGPGGVLAKVAMLRAPRYKAYLQILRGDAPQASTFCTWLVAAVRDEFGVNADPIDLKSAVDPFGPHPATGAATDGAPQIRDPLQVEVKDRDVSDGADGQKGKKIIKPYVGRPPKEAVTASAIYALSDYLLSLLCKDPTMLRKHLRAKAEFKFGPPVTGDQIDYALKKRGTSIRLFRQQYPDHGYCKKPEKESEKST